MTFSYMKYPMEIIILLFLEQEIKTTISRPSNRIQDECVIELINSDNDKVWSYLGWNLRLYFARSNWIFQNYVIVINDKTYKSKMKTRFSWNG